MPETPDPITPPVILDAQITPAHVIQALDAFKREVNTRLDTVEGTLADLSDTVKDSGLNGHTSLLKAFLEQYAASYSSRQAWLTVRSDIKHRLRWLAPSRHWLTILFGSIVGAIGWQLVSHFSGFQIPPL